jgi:hypothetical protein
MKCEGKRISPYTESSASMMVLLSRRLALRPPDVAMACGGGAAQALAWFGSVPQPPVKAGLSRRRFGFTPAKGDSLDRGSPSREVQLEGLSFQAPSHSPHLANIDRPNVNLATVDLTNTDCGFPMESWSSSGLLVRFATGRNGDEAMNRLVGRCCSHGRQARVHHSSRSVSNDATPGESTFVAA